MRIKILLFGLLFLILYACMNEKIFNNKCNILKDKVICVGPGHGGTAGIDPFRVGKNGEREEWNNLRVALILADML